MKPRHFTRIAFLSAMFFSAVEVSFPYPDQGNAGTASDTSEEHNQQPLSSTSHPNPARFFMKWDSWLEREPSYSREQMRQFAKYAVIIYGVPRDIADTLRRWAREQGNTDIKLLLYWTMRKAWKNTKGVIYTNEMFLRASWPNTNTTDTIVACEVETNSPAKYVVDITRPSLRDTVGEAIRRFGNFGDTTKYLNGVHFDSGAWDIYYKGRGNPIGVVGASDCPSSYPNSWRKNPDTTYPGKARDSAVAYHRHMQRVIDPNGTNTRIHIANSLPKNRVEWNQGNGDSYIRQYFAAGIDGMQMDGAMVGENLKFFYRDDADFQLSVPKIFIDSAKYFLFKSRAREDSALEYGFCAYLLVADGRYVLYGPAERILDFQGDTLLRKLLFAELGNPLSPYQPVANVPYTYMRAFQKGLVLLNADTATHTIPLPQGVFRDLRRNKIYRGTITLHKESDSGRARILLGLPDTTLLVSPTHNTYGLTQDVHLRWQRVPYAERYTVQVALDPSFRTVVVDDTTLADTMAVIRSLANDRWYYWRVRARNSAGIGAWSAVWRFAVGAPVPGTPTLVSPTDNAHGLSSTVQLIWQTTTDAEKYTVQVALDPACYNLVVDDSTVSDTVSVVRGLANNAWYYWRVRGHNIAATGPWSEVWRFAVVVPLPSAPQLISPENNSSQLQSPVPLRWHRALNAEWYTVQVSRDSLFQVLVVDDSTVADTTTIVQGLSENAWYYWRVRGHNIAATGPWSDVWRFAVGTPTGIQVQDQGVWDKPQLLPNSPNPFSTSTVIRFYLPQAMHVRLSVSDIHGREVARLADGMLNLGEHSVVFDASNLSGGMYFYQLRVGSIIRTQCMVLIK